jgi:hypothetical protein
MSFLVLIQKVARRFFSCRGAACGAEELLFLSFQEEELRTSEPLLHTGAALGEWISIERQ